MKTGWKDMQFSKPAREGRKGRRKEVMDHRWEVQHGNANIGSDAEIAAYLARVPKPYHYVEEEVSDE